MIDQLRQSIREAIDIAWLATEDEHHYYLQPARLPSTEEFEIARAIADEETTLHPEWNLHFESEMSTDILVFTKV